MHSHVASDARDGDEHAAAVSGRAALLLLPHQEQAAAGDQRGPIHPSGGQRLHHTLTLQEERERRKEVLRGAVHR